ncbi:MAG: GNAT family N-acetyltransferase [bacterium]|nr:GNAT family N-acetyltransferase [bacterium]
MAPTIKELTRDRLDEAVDVLCDAFYDYPVMRFVVGEAGEDYPRRLRRLVSFFTMARFIHRDLVWALTDAEEVLAVANINRPVASRSPEALDEQRRSLWADLGADARGRYEEHGNATAKFQWPEPHFHLGMIGVRRDQAAKGHGRRLLEALHDMSFSDPDSLGVSLTTETPSNVGLYERFGYEIVGHELAGEIETWGFFRPDGSR